MADTWEYVVLVKASDGWSPEPSQIIHRRAGIQSRSDALNELGGEGWRLVAVSDGEMFLARASERDDETLDR